MALSEVSVAALPPERFESVVTGSEAARLREAVALSEQFFKGRVVWNVNSTGTGGGVAEMLRSLIAYARGAGVDARWVVISGSADFFEVTKRLHNRLHGFPGDDGLLDSGEHRIYDGALAPNAKELSELVGKNDVVLLHDPQTAGLIPLLKATGHNVVWRCHVGLDNPNQLARQAWRFLLPYVDDADAYVFSRDSFAWEGLKREHLRVIPPSIDAFSPKNIEIDPATVGAILDSAGLLRNGSRAEPEFKRFDGSRARVLRRAEVYEVEPPHPETPVVLQVSRWDDLKDPMGVLRGFVDHVAPHTDAHLVYAGPAVDAVTDDPEGAEVLRRAIDYWQHLPERARVQLHLACLPMDDGEENAAIVNALQRHARVVVQKSLAEGFGLTVAEAMWKAKPVVASRIGGIQDQIEDGVTGVLLDDPYDLRDYGHKVLELLRDSHRAETIGNAARERVRDQFLGVRHLIQYLDLFKEIVAG